MPDVHESTYNAWIGRKQSTIRRAVLDCGHPKQGEVFFHIWCDRLSCSSECADAEHDCRQRQGKSGIEEEAVEPEAVVDAPGPPPAPVADPRQSTADFVRDVAAFGRYHGLYGIVSPPAGDNDGSAPICRGCRERPRTVGPFCDPCLTASSCDHSRVNERNGRHMVCIRPAGHQPPCEEGHPDGSQWVAGSGLAAGGVIREAGTATVDLAACNDRLDDFLGKVLYCAEEPGHRGPHRRAGTRWTDGASSNPVAPHVDELVEPDPDVPWWRRMLPGGTR